MNNNDKFIWKSNLYDEFKSHVSEEIFENKIYEKFFEVEENDIVFDVGASLGPFTFSILDKKPKHVFAFEPFFDEYKILVKNTNRGPVTQINKAISDKTENLELYWPTESFEDKEIVPITFMDAVSMYNVSKIDFLKCDCEGCEYEIFKNENLDWILNNVKKISGEWHLSNPELKDKFRKFRDEILSKFDSDKYQVMSIDGVDIKWELWSDNFINYYTEIILHIDNR